MPSIMIFIDWYAPAYKAGGPVIAALNFVERMKCSYRVYIFTGDRDLGDKIPFAGITLDKWTTLEANVEILYATSSKLNYQSIRSEIEAIQPDYVYLHSFYSVAFSLIPLALGRVKKIHTNIVLAPRGNLKTSALAHKPLKKQIFLKLFRMFRLHRSIIFHATDEIEASDIQKHFGNKNEIAVIPDFAASQPEFLPPPPKESGELKLVFVGRVHPIKNLDFILQRLKNISHRISFTIVGNVEEKEYWSKCAQLIDGLPDNISVTMKYQLSHDKIKEIIQQNHLFVLPTKGENFGHAIYESLSYGRPVLISDQTPWRNLQNEGAGWSIPLSEADAFEEAINAAALWDSAKLLRQCMQAWEFCDTYNKNSDLLIKYKNLFNARHQCISK